MDWRVIAGFAFLLIPLVIFIINAYLVSTPSTNTVVEYPYVITTNPSVLMQGEQSNIIYDKLNSPNPETALMTVITPNGSKTEFPIETDVIYTFPEDFDISQIMQGTYEFIVRSDGLNSEMLIDKTLNMTSFNPLAPLANGNGNAILLLMLGAIPTFWNYFQDLRNKQILQKDRKLQYTQNNLTILFDFINSCRHVYRKRSLLDSNDDNTVKDFVLSLLLQKCYQTKFNHYYLDNFKMEIFLTKLEILIMTQRDVLLDLKSFDQRLVDRQLSFYVEETYSKSNFIPDLTASKDFGPTFGLYVNNIKSGLSKNEYTDLLNKFTLSCSLYCHEFEKELNSILSISYSDESDIKYRNDKADVLFYDAAMKSHVTYLRKVFGDLVKSNLFPVLGNDY